ncbi:MAG: GntR family transcriptional regulator [Homoserinimonas sp.]|nr:GntR family transcriptional regulator [Homoserinimonas sp.]
MGRPPKNSAEAPPLELSGIKRESLSAQIIKSLTEYFFSGSLLAGSKLPSERQLAETLGVSRSAVRDAIQSLGLLGVVDIRQGDGTYLRDTGSELLPRVIEWGLFLGERRVMDLVEARQQVEISLAGLAARRRTDDDVAALRAILEQMDNASGPEEFVRLDISFHAAIAKAARNSVLADVLSNITSLIRVWMSRSIEAAGETVTSNDEHRIAFDAIAAGDFRAAQSAMRAHMRRAEQRLRRTLGHIPTEPSHLPAFHEDDRLTPG